MTWLANFFATINLIVWLALIGAALGAACAFVGGLFGGRLTGIAIGAAAGAVIMLGVQWTGVIDRMVSANAKATITKLETEKAQLQKELAIQLAANAVQEAVIANSSTVSAENEALLKKLAEIVDAHKDDETCTIHPDEIDLIDKLK